MHGNSTDVLDDSFQSKGDIQMNLRLHLGRYLPRETNDLMVVDQDQFLVKLHEESNLLDVVTYNVRDIQWLNLSKEKSRYFFCKCSFLLFLLVVSSCSMESTRPICNGIVVSLVLNLDSEMSFSFFV